MRCVGWVEGSPQLKLLLSASHNSVKLWKISQTDEPSSYYSDKTFFEFPKNGRRKPTETKLATKFKREFL